MRLEGVYFNFITSMVSNRLFEAPYCEIKERNDGIIYAKWKGFLKPGQVKTGCRFMTDYVRNNKITVHLSDHRDLRVLTKDVQDYLITEWFPEIENQGMKKIAALEAPDPFAKVTVDKVNKEAQVGNLIIRSFETEEDCINWLLE
ncbi:hypothetical protein [Sporocytophaga myxococcoides]|uniref:hypothetical protein n=1 Tax=Sporocytophaga myxococcoides TaxID=153721 RepID=UPI000423052F|nr:hypothetical protein [Sporocytophaga myxococcoides]